MAKAFRQKPDPLVCRETLGTHWCGGRCEINLCLTFISKRFRLPGQPHVPARAEGRFRAIAGPGPDPG